MKMRQRSNIKGADIYAKGYFGGIRVLARDYLERSNQTREELAQRKHEGS